MIVEYDFMAMTDKDVFEMKLKDAVPDFGYISNSKRKPFLTFLMKYNLIERTTELEHDDTFYGRFMPHMDFRFERLFDYSSKPVVVVKGIMMYTDKSSRLNHWRDA